MYPNIAGEVIGTAILIIFGCGVCANVTLRQSKAEGAGWLTVTVGWMAGVILGVYMAEAGGSVQADINPAVTFSKFLLGFYTFPHMLATMAAQVVGAFIGACLVFFHFYPHWALTEDPAAKLGIFCTSPAVRSDGANLFSEIFGTVILVICVDAIFDNLDHRMASQFGPYLIGILVWGIGVSLGGTTGYAINPARDLGPRLAHAILPIPGKGGSDWRYAWIPVVGPLVGAAIGCGLARYFYLSD